MGSATVSRKVACRAAYFESSAVTSYSDAKLPAATVATSALRHGDLAMIMSAYGGSCHESAGGLSRRPARVGRRAAKVRGRQKASQRCTETATVSELSSVDARIRHGIATARTARRSAIESPAAGGGR